MMTTQSTWIPGFGSKYEAVAIGNQREAQFLFFDEDKVPHVHEISFLSPITWLFRGTVGDLSHTLKSFVDHRTDANYSPRRFPWHALVASLLFLTAVPGLWVLVLYVTGAIVQFVKT